MAEDSKYGKITYVVIVCYSSTEVLGNSSTPWTIYSVTKKDLVICTIWTECNLQQYQLSQRSPNSMVICFLGVLATPKIPCARVTLYLHWNYLIYNWNIIQSSSQYGIEYLNLGDLSNIVRQFVNYGYTIKANLQMHLLLCSFMAEFFLLLQINLSRK